MGKDVVGPTPAEALSLPLVHRLDDLPALQQRRDPFGGAIAQERTTTKILPFVAGTIALGIAFLLGTAVEWRGLIHEHHLTISRNLFGTTYYTLVGFHGLHVTVGVIAMLIVLGLVARTRSDRATSHGRPVGRVVLALCRCRLDCGVSGRLRGEPGWRRMTNESDSANDSTSVDMPQPTAAPLVLAARHCAHGDGRGHESRILVRRRRCVHRWARDLDLATGCPVAAIGENRASMPSLRPQPIMPAPARSRAIAPRHARLSPAAAGKSPSGFGRHQRGHCRRAGYAATRDGLWTVERSWHLVARQFAGRHGVAGRWQHERRRVRAISSHAVRVGPRHSRRRVADPWLDLWRLDANAARISASRWPGVRC